MRLADPGTMTADERLEEVATLFARGYQRAVIVEFKERPHREILRDRLAALRPSEAPCGPCPEPPAPTP